ncbi:MAG: hypothetical protein LBK71_07895 [Verrucomicrobiales bacterium]|jgi:hypothetical protein|nr:hypothetical protein [Verrucomicrobiales bacterium]
MAKSTNSGFVTPVTTHRYDSAKRKNLPAAGDALSTPEAAPKISYKYDPHRTPTLRFNEEIAG